VICKRNETCRVIDTRSSRGVVVLDNANGTLGLTTIARLWRGACTACLLAAAGCAAVALVAPPNALAARTHADTVAETSGMQQLRPGSQRKFNGVQLASLGRETGPIGLSHNTLGERSVRWNASPTCLNSTLRRIVGEVAANFGPVTVNSTCRSHSHNARVGGAKQSHHLTGNAADFRISGSTRRVLAYLNAHRSVGGLKHYGGGVFHIDTGPRRSW
jgi:hypothetical protein